jgi:hypothetical protein
VILGRRSAGRTAHLCGRRPLQRLNRKLSAPPLCSPGATWLNREVLRSWIQSCLSQRATFAARALRRHELLRQRSRFARAATVDGGLAVV